MKDIIYEQYKNFKILFRNLSSVLLLVIGPLALILLIGFAYSGESIHDIRIGVVSTEYESLSPMLSNFTDFASLKEYDSIDRCVEDIRSQSIHLCLHFSDDFGEPDNENVPEGTITFYYDNTEKSLSSKIVDEVSDYFGVEAEKISIDSARTIFSNIQTFVAYLGDKNEDILELLNESQSIKSDLIERKAKLIEIRDEFNPVYREIKDIQSDLGNVSGGVDKSYNRSQEDTNRLISQLDILKLKLMGLNDETYFYFSQGKYVLAQNVSAAANQTIFKLSDYNYSLSNQSLIIDLPNASAPAVIDLSDIGREKAASLSAAAAIIAIDQAEQSLRSLSASNRAQYDYMHKQKDEFDHAVSLLDNVKVLLDSDIQATDEYIIKIDAASENINTIHNELNSSLGKFSRIDSTLADKLINPIIQNYEPLLPDAKNIAIAFPGMLAIIIIFISILFANIVTLAEINSKAFYRNTLAPVSSMLFISGLVITNIIVVFFQISVLLIVGQTRFGIPIAGSFLPAALIIILLSLLFICLGMIIAILFRRVQTSILTTTFLALAFFLFSNSVTPLEAMPPLASVIAAKNPFVIASLAFKKLLVLGLPAGALGNEIFYLGSYFVLGACTLILISLLKFNNKA